VYADICGGSSGRGHQMTVELSMMAIFSIFGGYFFRNFWDKASLIIQDMQCHVGFSVIPKCVTLN